MSQILPTRIAPATGAREPLTDLADHLSHTMAVARALLRGGRTLDLGGLEDGVGLLCAQALDRPAEEARRHVPALYALLRQADSLIAELRSAREDGAAPP